MVVSIMDRTCSPEPTSMASASASPPADSISATTPRAVSPLRSATTTLAPSAANRFAVASPMPLPAPVTTATLPFRRSMHYSLVRCPAPVLGALVAHQLDRNSFVYGKSGSVRVEFVWLRTINKQNTQHQ